MKLKLGKSATYSILFCSLLGLSSCEKILRDMATKETPGQVAQADTAQTATAPAEPARPKEPEFELTFPENSPYKDLAAPKGAKTNPFTEVQRIAEQYEGNPNWADKHADLNGLLLQSKGKDYYPILQQQAANEMLRHELFPHYYQDQNNVRMLNAIGLYTEHLLEAKTEDSELVYKCLRALQGHWPEDRLAAAARVTAERALARPITSAADTTTRNGSYRQIYARELKKMAKKLNGES
ncbi:hypothetical protein [Rufibacter ruber]|uniref:hypothetical protein n=1 Tax=Rufibacter ruber TaxID=1783499 RepID=UPI00082B0CEB|nr:hypothetical protein [Rufibacter ruber]